MLTQDLAKIKPCAIFLRIMFKQCFKVGFRLIPKHKALTQYPGGIKRVEILRIMRKQFLKLLERRHVVIPFCQQPAVGKPQPHAVRITLQKFISKSGNGLVVAALPEMRKLQ